MFHVGKLLRKAGACKEKGVPVMKIFRYALGNVFNSRSMYMQMRTESYREDFSKNTYYRFLNSMKTDWLRFTTLLSASVIGDFMKRLTAKIVRMYSSSMIHSSHDAGTSAPKPEDITFDHSMMIRSVPIFMWEV